MMKYETSFQTCSNHGKPVIFWEQQAMVGQRSKKKFPYKGKEQKHALRKAVTEPALQSTSTKPDAKSLSQTGTRTTSRRQVQRAAAPPQRVKGGAVGNKPPTSTSSRQKPVSDGTVTLTQVQLNKILETIGELTVENVDLKEKLDDGGNTGAPGPGVKNTEPSASQVAPAMPPGEESGPQMEQNQPMSTQEAASATTQEVPGLSTTATVHTGSETSAVPVTPSQPSEPSVIQPVQSQPVQVSDQKPTQLEIPRGHMTVAERKRLQWERERADINKQTDWDPWGRPGGGAPLKDQQGNLLTDYSTRKGLSDDTTKSTTDLAAQNDEVFIKQAYQTPQPASCQTVQVVAISHPSTATTAQSTVQPTQHLQAETSIPGLPGHTANVSTATIQPSDAVVQSNQTNAVPLPADKPLPPPAAMRSSFAIGVPAPNEDRYASAKEREKQQWLADLEKQREEQRQRKLQTKQKDPSLQDTWADRFTTQYIPAQLPKQEMPPPVQQPVDDSTIHGSTQPLQETTRTNSAPVVAQGVPQGAVTPTPSTFLRGQNVMLDQATIRELEEKRRKNQEYQEYVRKQMEEHEKIKQQERQRRIAEEQAEEQRLARERDMMQNQFKHEQQRQRQKEEEQMHRVEALKEAMDKAREEAERAKHQQRLRHLQQGGHDVSHLHAKFEAKMSPRDAPYTVTSSTTLNQNLSAPPQATAGYPSAMATPGINPVTSTGSVHVQPSYVPGLELTPRPEETSAVPPYRDPAELTHYHEYSQQQAALASTRSSIVQDDANIMYDGPIHEVEPKPQKRVRLKSAPKEDKPSVKKKGPVSIHERPRWGQSGAKKKKVPTATLR